MTATDQLRFNQLQSELATATERKDEANEALDKAEKQLAQARQRFNDGTITANTLALVETNQARASRLAYAANMRAVDLEEEAMRLLRGAESTAVLCF